MNTTRWPVALALLLGVSGCALFGPERASGEVEVRIVDATHLLAANNTEADIYYFAVGQETATLIDWAPVIDERNRIPAAAQRRVEAMGAEDENTILFYWWHALDCLAPWPDCPTAGEVQTITVRR